MGGPAFQQGLKGLLVTLLAERSYLSGPIVAWKQLQVAHRLHHPLPVPSGMSILECICWHVQIVHDAAYERPAVAARQQMGLTDMSFMLAM